MTLSTDASTGPSDYAGAGCRLGDDSSDDRSRSCQREITAAVSVVVEDRAIIEQAKGMLMFIYGIDAEAAFALLRWQSQENNVKLRLVAEQIAEDLIEASQQNPPVNRLSYDRLLLSAHARAGTRGSLRQAV